MLQPVHFVWLGPVPNPATKAIGTPNDFVQRMKGDNVRLWCLDAHAQAFRQGLVTNLLNPKIGAFYLATIPQFVPAGVSPLGMGLLLAGVHDLLAVAWFALIIAGASYARRWLANARALRVVDRVAGVTLVGFGVKLALPGH